MNNKIGQMLNLTERLLEISKNILGKLNIKVKRTDSSLTDDEIYNMFLHMYTNTAWQLASGAYLCCKYGFGIAGIGAARAIFEMLTTLKYINLDRDSRLERYFYFPGVTRKLITDSVTAANRSVPGEVLRQRLFEFEEFKKKYQNTPYSKHWWSGMNIEDMGKEIKWTKDEELIYGKLSTIAHIGPVVLEEYLKQNSQDEIQICSELTPTTKYSDEVLTIVLGKFPQILDFYLKAWDIEYPPELIQICNEIIDLLEVASK